MLRGDDEKWRTKVWPHVRWCWRNSSQVNFWGNLSATCSCYPRQQHSQWKVSRQEKQPSLEFSSWVGSWGLDSSAKISQTSNSSNSKKLERQDLQFSQTFTWKPLQGCPTIRMPGICLNWLKLTKFGVQKQSVLTEHSSIFDAENLSTNKPLEFFKQLQGVWIGSSLCSQNENHVKIIREAVTGTWEKQKLG